MATFDSYGYKQLTKEIVDLAVEKTIEERKAEYRESSQLPDAGPGPEPTKAERAEIEEAFGWIPERFTKRVPPDPSKFDLTIDSLGQVPGILGKASWKRGGEDGEEQKEDPGTDNYKGEPIPSDAMNDVAYVDTVGSDWNGEAATAFRDHVRIPLPFVMSNNTEATRALKAAFERAQSLYSHGRDDLMTLARTTRDALEQLPQNVDRSSGMAQIAAITTATAGVATFFPGPGTAIAATFTILAGVAAEAGRRSAENADDDLSLKGSSVDEVLGKMTEALVEYDEKHQRTEQKLADSMLNYLGGKSGGGGIAAQSAPGKAMILKAPNEVTAEPPPGEDRGDEFAPDSIMPWL